MNWRIMFKSMIKISYRQYNKLSFPSLLLLYYTTNINNLIVRIHMIINGVNDIFGNIFQ